MTNYEIHKTLLKGSIQLLDSNQITLKQFADKVNEVIIDRDNQDYEYIRNILTELNLDVERVNYLTDLFKDVHGLQDKDSREVFGEVLQEACMMLINGNINGDMFKMLITNGFIGNNVSYEYVNSLLIDLKITDMRLPNLIKEAYSK